MKNETEDIVYRCKDCIKYNLCQYYYRRKETSQICHYFELPERKTGKWILAEMGDTNVYKCSLCGNRRTCTPPFCDICGAEMEVEECQ